MGQSNEELWAQYESGVESARSELLDQYLGLVYSIARQVLRGLPEGVELDDLVNAGTLGLVLALERFDRTRGLAFSTYATPRIRGAILDDLRSRDWVPRSVRSKARRISAAESLLQNTLQRVPTTGEVSLVLGVEPSTVGRWRERVGGAVLVSLDSTTTNGKDEVSALDEIIPDRNVLVSDLEVSRKESVEILKDAVDSLPSKERAVLALYYYEELNLRQIGDVMHLTESRISQIRTGALARLRSMMEVNAPLRSAAGAPGRFRRATEHRVEV